MNLLDMVKGQLTDSVVNQLGGAVGLNGADVTKAMGAIIPAQFDSIIRQGSTEQGAGNLLEMASKFTQFGNVGQAISQPNGIQGMLQAGTTLLPMLFGGGNKHLDIIKGIAGMTGIGNNAIGGLMGMAAPMIMGALGNHAKSAGLNAGGLMGMLGGMAGPVANMMPGGLGNVLSGVLGAGGAAGALGSLASGAANMAGNVVGQATGAATGALGGAADLAGKAVGQVGDLGKVATGAAGALGGAATGAAGALGGAAAAGRGGIPAWVWALPVAALLAFLGLRGCNNASTATTGTDTTTNSSGTTAGGTDTGAATGATTGTDTTGAAAAGATCDKTYTLSVKDGETLAEPFRFGGDGKGASYFVTVKRGGRTIGTKEMKLGADCTWGYDSKPGKGPITYEVRESADATATALSTVNLTVK